MRRPALKQTLTNQNGKQMNELLEGCIKGEVGTGIVLREAIRAELDAVNLYTMFAEMLRDTEHETELKKGSEEVKEKYPYTIRRG